MFQETFLPSKGSQDTLLVETRLRTGGCRGHTHSRAIPVAGLRTPSLAIGLHSQTEYAAGSSVQIIMTVRHMDGAFQTIRILGGYHHGSLGLSNERQMPVQGHLDPPASFQHSEAHPARSRRRTSI